MENASKALIIAGAILLAILLIGLGVFVYNQSSHTVNDTNLDQLEIAKFNQQFEPYLNKEISGTTAKSLVKTIESSNFASEPQVYCAGVTQSDIKKAHTYETIVKYDNGVITQILLRDLDDNVIIGNDAESGNENGSGSVVLTQAYVNGFFTDFLNRNLNPGEVRRLLNNIDQCNRDIEQYQDSVLYNVSYVTYVGPKPLEIEDNKTYTATAEMNKNEYIMLITVTQNPYDDDIGERER